MKKIKITQTQYNRLILAEQKRLKSNKIMTENEEVLEEGWKEIVATIMLLSGLGNDLDAQEVSLAKNSLKDKNSIEQVQNVVNNEENAIKLKDALKKIKVKDSDKIIQQLSNNAEIFEKNFENISKKDYGETRDIKITNLKSLPGLAKSGYAVKDIKHSVDTIKGQTSVKKIIVNDTLTFKMENMGDMFITGKYKLSNDGVNAINENLKFLKDSGLTVLSVKIVSSTDKQRMPSFVSKEDKTGNVKLAQLRANSVLDIIKGNEVIGGAPIEVVTLPNQGNTTAEEFAAAENTPQENILQDNEQSNRFVDVIVVVQDTIELEEPTPQPDKFIEKWEIELVKNYEISHDVVHINRKSSNIVKKGKISCNIKDTGVANCFKNFGK
jgi:hypothetical protein